MAFGLEIYNLIPDPVYQIIHVIELLLGLYFAYKANSMGAQKAAVGFVLWGLTGLVSLLVHLGYVALPFSHLVDRVFFLVAMILFYMSWKK